MEKTNEYVYIAASECKFSKANYIERLKELLKNDNIVLDGKVNDSYYSLDGKHRTYCFYAKYKVIEK